MAIGVVAIIDPTRLLLASLTGMVSLNVPALTRCTATPPGFSTPTRCWCHCRLAGCATPVSLRVPATERAHRGARAAGRQVTFPNAGPAEPHCLSPWTPLPPAPSLRDIVISAGDSTPKERNANNHWIPRREGHSALACLTQAPRSLWPTRRHEHPHIRRPAEPRARSRAYGRCRHGHRHGCD